MKITKTSNLHLIDIMEYHITLTHFVRRIITVETTKQLSLFVNFNASEATESKLVKQEVSYTVMLPLTK